ncbi:MAG: fibronectin type III domain-containing protein [Flavobacteriales bacterium]|nr:fibronectin type III domain-containing protein [Flavobacteriales bacterium]
MSNYRPTIILVFIFSFLNSSAQSIIVKPYLQNATSNSITIMWESSNCNPGIIEWGTSNSLGSIVAASLLNSQGSACIFTGNVIGLQPETKYFYRVATGNVFSPLYSFITPSLRESESSISLVAMSDMQKDNGNPDKFHQISNDGIISHITTTFSGDLNQNLQLILIPGDLVDDGNNHDEWVNDFFNQGENLFSYVPFYPVPGNHENNAHFFFDYFDLPKNGSNGFMEHWWYKDVSNVRIIGLDSNHDYQLPQQLDWLDSILNATSSDTLIDFVFAQLHHPHHSELWPPGNTDFTGEVISLLEFFSSSSGKPSIHFFGHTHGYSRGQSRDHSHLMVNVATAGGNIDYWDEYSQIDYQEYTVSDDDYGYVFVEVDAGEDPKFTIKRFSLGDEYVYESNKLKDSITVKLNNQIPEEPYGVYPLSGEIVSPDGFTILGSPFIDPDGDGHGATQWQVSTSCIDFSSTVFDRWIQHENWYKGLDSQQDDNLLDIDVLNLLPDINYCWRVRYRDKGLGWSNWSNPISFTTDSVFMNWKVYPNPIANVSTLNIPYSEDLLLKINIFSSTGKLISSFENISPPVFKLYKNDLKRGVYYLQILHDKDRLGLIKFLVAEDG